MQHYLSDSEERTRTAFEEEINFLKHRFSSVLCQHIEKQKHTPLLKITGKQKKKTLQMTQHTSTQNYTKATVHLPPPTCPPVSVLYHLPRCPNPVPGIILNSSSSPNPHHQYLRSPTDCNYLPGPSLCFMPFPG